MDTASNCGMTTDIYDEVFTIRSHARTPNYRCVVTMNTGYSGTHSIEIISENVRITDCGVRLGIYDGANTDGHQLVRLYLVYLPGASDPSLGCKWGSCFLIYSFMCNVFRWSCCCLSFFDLLF